MAYQTPRTVREVLDDIAQERLVLPAIQREYVWVSDLGRMTRLFDSLLRKYPIGTFLHWNVPAAEAAKFDFYKFMHDWHERDRRHNPRLELATPRDLTAVLDGQQRLTTLNIGLRGSITQRRKWKRAASLDAYVTKYLYVDLLFEPDEDSDVEYRFEFLTPEQATKDASVHWYRVRDILNVEHSGRSIFEYVRTHGLAELERPYDVLSTLYQAVHQDGVVSAFEERGERLDRVLDIFVRVNSGGLVLSKSDLLLSMATAHFRTRDARQEVHDLVDELNGAGDGFAFSKDLILKAGLVLTGISDIGFRVENFTASNVARLEENWDRIATALRLAVELLTSFGFTGKTLPANSVLIPIADYAYCRGLDQRYLDSQSQATRADRAALRQWLLRTILMPGVWGSGLDGLVRSLHRVIVESVGPFPVAALETEMARRGKALNFNDTLIDDLLDTEYKHPRAFALLSLLYETVDTQSRFHIDHVWPRSMATRSRLLSAGLDPRRVEEVRDKVERLPNLQLLHGPVNVDKRAQLPARWARDRFPNDQQRNAWLAENHMLELPESFAQFPQFYDLRRSLIRDRLLHLLGAEAASSPTPSPASKEPETTNEGHSAHDARADITQQGFSPAFRPSSVHVAHAESQSPVTTMPAGPALEMNRPRGTTYRHRNGESLADLILDGRLSVGQELYGSYYGTTHVCTVEPDGSVMVDGTRHTSLSAAAKQINGGSEVNGWKFWRLADGRDVATLRR